MKHGDCRCYVEQKMTTTSPPRRVIRIPEVRKRVGLSRIQIWRKTNDPTDAFPAAVELGPNSIGFYESEIEDWLASRPRRGACPDAADAGPAEAA